MVVHSNNICPLYYPTFLTILYTEIPKSFPGCTRISLLTPFSCGLPEKKTSDDVGAKIYWLALSFTEKHTDWRRQTQIFTEGKLVKLFWPEQMRENESV